MKEYTRRDIGQLTDATESNLTHWSKIGLLRADVRETQGTGHHRRFSFRAVVEAEIAANLNRFGTPVAGMKALLEVFRYFGSGGNSKGAEAASFKRWLSSEDPATLQKICEEWRAFVDPLRRQEFGFVGLVVEQFSGQWWFCIDRIGESFMSERIAQAPATIVINIGHILSKLEAATGDRWPSEDVAAEPRVRHKRR